MHVETKSLPAAIRKALEAVSYFRKEIRVRLTEETSLSVSGGSGQRGFSIIGDMESGAFNVSQGSWGGSNMFNPKNAVDNDMAVYKLPPNAFAITGTTGESTFATLYVSPASVNRLAIAAPTESRKRRKRRSTAIAESEVAITARKL